jgi:phosphatidylserine decarboxylase
LVRDGIPFVTIPAVLALILLAFGYWAIAIILIAIALFMAYFFRDPKRHFVFDPNVVIAPADGKITRIVKLDPQDPGSPHVISIFLSVFDVHINRAPIAGKITDITYTKGRFLIATREDTSLVNEQNAVTIQGQNMTVVCKQIAGILARRIVCWKRSGESVALGEKFGLIKFSSRTDLILPANVDIAVQVGARVRGGLTIIGKLSQS